MKGMTMKRMLAVALLAGLGAGTALAQDAPYREYAAPETYEPRVEGDLSLSRTFPYWRDRNQLDPTKAGNPDEFWKLNWKFMDPPYNQSVHGGHFALDRGEGLYKELNRKGTFARCLGAEKGRLKGLRTTYPRYRPDLKRVAGLEEVIEYCAGKENKELQNGSYDNSAVSLFIASQSNGMPMRVDVARGPMKEAYERGRKLFHQRSGKFNLACSSCHTDNAGRRLRGTTITTPYGDAVHFPVYRARYELQSLQLRLVECNEDAGTQPLKPGSQAYTDLEVFLTGLSNGYHVIVPSERY